MNEPYDLELTLDLALLQVCLRIVEEGEQLISEDEPFDDCKFLQLKENLQQLIETFAGEELVPCDPYNHVESSCITWIIKVNNLFVDGNGIIFSRNPTDLSHELKSLSLCDLSSRKEILLNYRNNGFEELKRLINNPPYVFSACNISKSHLETLIVCAGISKKEEFKNRSDLKLFDLIEEVIWHTEKFIQTIEDEIAQRMLEIDSHITLAEQQSAKFQAALDRIKTGDYLFADSLLERPESHGYADELLIEIQNLIKERDRLLSSIERAVSPREILANTEEAINRLSVNKWPDSNPIKEKLIDEKEKALKSLRNRRRGTIACFLVSFLIIAIVCVFITVND